MDWIWLDDQFKTVSKKYEQERWWSQNQKENYYDRVRVSEKVRSQQRKSVSRNWNTLSLVEQLANVGSEVERTINWKNKGNLEYSNLAFERSLELLDLAITCPHNRKRLTELTRLREVLVDYFVGKNQFSSTDELWQKYFFCFQYSVRKNSWLTTQRSSTAYFSQAMNKKIKIKNIFGEDLDLSGMEGQRPSTFVLYYLRHGNEGLKLPNHHWAR